MAITVIGQDGLGWCTTPSNLSKYWVGVHNTSLITFGAGPDGNGKAIKWSDTGSSYRGYLWSQAFTPVAKICMEGHWKFDSLGNDSIAVMLNAGSVSLDMQMTSSGQIAIGNYTGSFIGTSAATIVTGNWYKIQWQVYCHATLGQVKVYVNGNLILDLSGVNTTYWGSAQVDAVRFQCKFGSAVWFANPIWYTFDTIGTDRFDSGAWIRTIRYNAEGTHTDATANTGTKVAAINDTDPDSDTTYDYTTANGQRETFTIAPLGLTVGPFGVCAKYLGRKDNSGTSALSPSIRTHSTDYDGTSVAQSTSYQVFSKTWTMNPNTGAAWTPAEVDAIEGGWVDSR